MQRSQKSLPSQGYVRLDQLIGSDKNNSSPVIPVSRSTIWNWVNDGKFPKPIKLSPRVTVWNVKDINNFLEHGGYIE